MNQRTVETGLRDEDGATVIILALLLVVLMGFAAIAVDAAAAWALKRRDQSGADTGALAGALFTANRTRSDAIRDAEDEIIRITYSTMEPDMTFAEWEAEWTSCTDPAKPAEFTTTLNSDCISFTSNVSKIRVQTPVVPWETTFGRVIGIDRIDLGKPERLLEGQARLLQGDWPVPTTQPERAWELLFGGAAYAVDAQGREYGDAAPFVDQLLEPPFWIGPGCSLGAGARIGPNTVASN